MDAKYLIFGATGSIGSNLAADRDGKIVATKVISKEKKDIISI